jgi:hypothetical protein
MTIELFMFLFTIGSLVSSLLTQALKKAHKSFSSNVIALIDALLVGGAGTCSAYLIMEISWTPTNVVCIFLMVFCVWVGSMVGYDKVMQTIAQLKR